jgi:hypothetical protein
LVTAAFRPIQQNENPTVTQFLYDRLNPVQELNSSGRVTVNLLTGLKIDEFFHPDRIESTTSTLLADALGSTIGPVGSGGTIGTSYTYQPFGATTSGDAATNSSKMRVFHAADERIAKI